MTVSIYYYKKKGSVKLIGLTMTPAANHNRHYVGACWLHIATQAVWVRDSDFGQRKIPMRSAKGERRRNSSATFAATGWTY